MAVVKYHNNRILHLILSSCVLIYAEMCMRVVYQAPPQPRSLENKVYNARGNVEIIWHGKRQGRWPRSVGSVLNANLCNHGVCAADTQLRKDGRSITKRMTENRLTPSINRDATFTTFSRFPFCHSVNACDRRRYEHLVF